MKGQLENRYKLNNKVLKLVTDELNQRFDSTSVKLTRHEARAEQ